ncbi:MAG: T9SS type A sorting domain-containing protein [Bacteroidota bacterium]
MRVVLFIFAFIQITLSGQDNFISIYDYNGLSQGYSNLFVEDDEIYSLGVSICSTGECGILSHYTNQGELVQFAEIDNIDVNSSRCFTLRNDTLLFIALSKYEVGSRLQKYNLDGIQIDDIRVIRDSTLVYTWPLDVIYDKSEIFLAVNENYDNEARQTAIYKLDYQGNVLDYIRLPYYWQGGILTLTQLQNGNLFVTQPYLDDGICAFEHGEPTRPNAVIFYEIDSDSLEIIRDKQNVCYQSTRSVSYDSRVLSNGNIVRNALWRDSLNENIFHAANFYYDSDWNFIGVDKYPQAIIGSSIIAEGILGNRTFASKDSSHFYVVASISYPQPGEDFPYIDFLIQKWDIDRNLIWERVISDSNVHKRIYFNSLYESESQITLAGYVWSDFDIGGTQDFAVMTLDSDGCFNGDCRDTIYLNGSPTSTLDVDEDSQISVYPNPFWDQFTVTAFDKIQSVSCYSLEGTLVMQWDVDRWEYTMDLVEQPSGMYLIWVETETGRYVKKMVKN